MELKARKKEDDTDDDDWIMEITDNFEKEKEIVEEDKGKLDYVNSKAILYSVLPCSVVSWTHN